MRIFSKLPSALFATGTATALLGALALPNLAQASVDFSSDTPSYNDKIVAIHSQSYGEYSLRNTKVSVDDLHGMQETLKSNAKELENLKKTVSDQARLIEELKRNSGSSSSSSANELSNLKREVSDQDREMDKLKHTVEDLSRKVK